MSEHMDLTRTAAELKRAFDESFAAPVPEASAAPISLLLVRIGTGRYALRMADLTGVEVGRRIVPLPAEDPALLGLAGIRGRLVPVYCLHTLLGYDRLREPPDRFVLCGRAEPVGLSIDEIEGHVYVSPAELHSSDAQATQEHLREVLIRDEVARGVLDVPSILAAIEERADQGAAPKET
jgi:purine-binding chemotaxis protein CheW